jgi:hypothetical protein
VIFELHCHTHHSRGSKIPAEVMLSPSEVVRLARRLLRSFVGSRNRGWNSLGRFAIGCTALYSGVKLLTY